MLSNDCFFLSHRAMIKMGSKLLISILVILTLSCQQHNLKKGTIVDDSINQIGEWQGAVPAEYLDIDSAEVPALVKDMSGKLRKTFPKAFYSNVTRTLILFGKIPESSHDKIMELSKSVDDLQTNYNIQKYLNDFIPKDDSKWFKITKLKYMKYGALFIISGHMEATFLETYFMLSWRYKTNQTISQINTDIISISLTSPFNKEKAKNDLIYFFNKVNLDL